MEQSTRLAERLLLWHSTVDRELPWKKTADPYQIWLSEIIMQQTRVAQGLPYYLRFVEAYPTVADLAAASENDILKLWEGLGYYSRARNMHHAAKTIMADHGGKFPRSYEEVISLKGVGKYTAAAIVSFAYGDRYPVVDGNVLRAVTRLYGIHEAIDDSKTIKKIYAISSQLIATVDPAKYNQAIMDHGALVCKPKSPLCKNCVWSEDCVARSERTVSEIPFKAKKVKKRNRFFHYFYIKDSSGRIAIKRREEKDIWQGLYDLPQVELETDHQLTAREAVSTAEAIFGVKPTLVSAPTKTYRHMLTHQILYAVFYKMTIADDMKSSQCCSWVAADDLEQYGKPVLISDYLADQQSNLF